MPDPTRSAYLAVDLGPWLVAFAALLQPWIIKLYEKRRKPAIEMFPTGKIEIGFSGLGPTVGLLGTLRVLHRDAFVKAIRLIVTRERDGARHSFAWRAFRSRSLAPSNRDLEFAYSFMLKRDEPHDFNVVFVDDPLVAEITPRLEPLRAAWRRLVEERWNRLGDLAVFSEDVFPDFSKTREVTDAYTIVDRAFYWEPGRYSLAVNIECSRPDVTLNERRSFQLTEADSQLLRLNVVGIIRTVIGLNVPYWNLAFPQYEDA